MVVLLPVQAMAQMAARMVSNLFMDAKLRRQYCFIKFLDFTGIIGPDILALFAANPKNTHYTASECTRGKVFGVFEHFRCRESTKSAPQAFCVDWRQMVEISPFARTKKARADGQARAGNGTNI